MTMVISLRVWKDGNAWSGSALISAWYLRPKRDTGIVVSPEIISTPSSG